MHPCGALGLGRIPLAMEHMVIMPKLIDAVRLALPRLTEPSTTADQRAAAWVAFQEMAQAVLASDGPLPAEVLRAVAPAAADGVFNSWAYGVACEAVVRSDPQLIRYGIVALMLDNGRYDARERFVQMVLLEQSSIKMSVDFASELCRLYYLFPGTFRRFARNYMSLSPSEKTLECIGHREIVDERGVRYSAR